MFRRPPAVPVYRPDIYTRAAILDPHPHYRALRELGPVVWLARHRLYALPRYAACKATLRDDGRFLSGHGVAANPLTNRLSRGTTLNSDGADHDRRRKLLAHRMMPRALRALGDDIDAQARAIVEVAVHRERVDAVADLATALPLAVVPDLVGWPRDERARLLDWGAATFDVLGPANLQALRAVPRSLQMLRFARRVVRDRNVLPGSMAHELLTAVDEGNLAVEEVPPLLIDYIAPSLDTTISAISNAIYLFARHPDQWELLKSDPALIPNAVNEVVRYESRSAPSPERHCTAQRSRGCPSLRAPGCWSFTPQPTVTNANGMLPTSSTSATTPDATSGSATARTPAPAKPLRGSRPPQCSKPSPRPSSASRSPPSRPGRSTTSSTATNTCRCG